MSAPEDLQVVGYVSGAYGVQGWVRIKPYSADAGALLQTKTWWIDKPDLHDVDVLQSKSHGGDVVASLMGIAGRDAAEALKGAVVQIARSHFPALEKDEFYWVDLIGLAVVNMQGEALGKVIDLMDNGAHPILRIVDDAGAGAVASDTVADADADADAAANGPAARGKPGRVAETLIPFVEQFVKSVDHDNKLIVVDWGRDY